MFVPASMALPSKSPPPQGGATKAKKQRAHHAHVSPSGGAGLDDYFKEGEQKSLEEDYAPKVKTGGPPPPPKAGGPPKGGPPKSGTPVQRETVEAKAEAERGAEEEA